MIGTGFTRIARIVVLAVLVSMGGCDTSVEYESRSIVEVVVTPSRFFDRRINLRGYYGENILGPFLYLTREHAQMLDLSNAIRLGRTSDGVQFATIAECDSNFVSVFGRFAMLDTGAYGLTDIERVVVFGMNGAQAGGTCFRARTQKFVDQQDESR